MSPIPDTLTNVIMAAAATSLQNEMSGGPSNDPMTAGVVIEFSNGDIEYADAAKVIHMSGQEGEYLQIMRGDGSTSEVSMDKVNYFGPATEGGEEDMWGPRDTPSPWEENMPQEPGEEEEEGEDEAFRPGTGALDELWREIYDQNPDAPWQEKQRMFYNEAMKRGLIDEYPEHMRDGGGGRRPDQGDGFRRRGGQGQRGYPGYPGGRGGGGYYPGGGGGGYQPFGPAYNPNYQRQQLGQQQAWQRRMEEMERQHQNELLEAMNDAEDDAKRAREEERQAIRSDMLQAFKSAHTNYVRNIQSVMQQQAGYAQQGTGALDFGTPRRRGEQ